MRTATSVSAEVKQSGGAAADDLAKRAAMQWEFKPMLLNGRPVPGNSVIRFDF